MINRYSLNEHGWYYRLSDNFTLGEFACHDGSDTVLVCSDLIASLELIRKVCNAPVIIKSGYRNAAHNKKIGGVSNSQHVRGRAADITVIGYSPGKVGSIAKDISLIGGVGIYSGRGFTHIDTRPRKPDGSIAKWTG